MAIRVALSMLSLVPGGMGGSETYARQLSLGLGHRRDVGLIAVVPGNAAGFTGLASEQAVPSVVARDSTIGRLVGIAAARLAGRHVRRGLDDREVVHYPFTIPVPRPARGQARVMTVHDVQHRDLPHLFSRAERLFRVFAYEIPARRADLVITISEFARDSIVRHLRVHPDRVRVIPLGVDAASFSPQLSGREPFLLYPARGWPHKNHARLFEAVRIVRETWPELRLVLTGGNLDALGPVPEWVDVRGLVPVEELHDLYRRASVMVFPSLYEGFGLPPLEAMASGCPVAASDAGSIPEVCGDAAVLFDPTDPRAIARGILEALDRSDDLARRGLEHAARFTWDACVDAHISAYHDAVELHRTVA
ncbi:glycosyltransferase involved in cell wall biosynthesis [Agromyces sp. 3263]|uniref:glycosyltransferase family 4 protein n=1 Tax=Agromyces sp. 3263 TaxID=2817750 RepID=UPI00285C530B|nr:glycosyltransferase family 1 protein [Agromyces sp. 3263]MDR6904637.1 glycosyltransferase involved in cell wall biosynthesis [Agromyces sp. 3263]